MKASRRFPLYHSLTRKKPNKKFVANFRGKLRDISKQVSQGANPQALLSTHEQALAQDLLPGSTLRPALGSYGCKSPRTQTLRSIAAIKRLYKELSLLVDKL